MQYYLDNISAYDSVHELFKALKIVLYMKPVSLSLTFNSFSIYIFIYIYEEISHDMTYTEVGKKRTKNLFPVFSKTIKQTLIFS